MNLFRLAHALKFARSEIKKPDRRPKGDIVIVKLSVVPYLIYVARRMRNNDFEILWPIRCKVSGVSKIVVITEEQILAAAQ